MPKLKTHKSTVKRVKITGTGQVSLRHANTAHRMRFKSKRAKQLSNQSQIIGGKIGKKMKEVVNG